MGKKKEEKCKHESRCTVAWWIDSIGGAYLLLTCVDCDQKFIVLGESDSEYITE